MKKNNVSAPVSVIIPCFKCKETIVRAIESISNQTLIPTEVILIEDCSGDSTLEFLHDLKKNYTNGWLKVLSLEHNSGPATARNKGWGHASQEYIAFLDSDDSWHPSKIEIQYSWMKKNETAVMSGHATEIYEESYKSTKLTDEFTKVSISEMILSNKIPTRTVMLRRDIDLRFPDGKRYAEDYLLWMRIIHQYSHVFFLNRVLAFSYKGDFDAGGLTSNLWSMHIGLLDTYKTLYQEKCISFPTLAFVYSLNYFKLSLRYLKKKLMI